ncbi:MAG: hypothetical protein AAFQ98_11290 [Bacteroidota bacterium]
MKLTDDILERYFAGELSPTEIKEVEQALAEEASLGEAVQLTKAWEQDPQLGLRTPSPDFSSRVMLQVLKKRFSFRELVQTNTLGFLSGTSGMVLGGALALVGLILIGVFGVLPQYYPNLDLPTLPNQSLSTVMPVFAGLASLLLLFLFDRQVLKKYFGKPNS